MTQMRWDRLGWRRVAVIAAAVVIAGHGLVHLMGTALLWKLGEPGQLRYADAVPAPGSAAGYVVGGLWLVAAVLFATAMSPIAERQALGLPVPQPRGQGTRHEEQPVTCRWLSTAIAKEP